MANFLDRLSHAWNAFTDREDGAGFNLFGGGVSYGGRSERIRTRVSNERSILASAFNRIAVDASGISIHHVRLDNNQRYLEFIDSGLNNCLTVEANIDQGARAFRQDMVHAMIEHGVIAIVPVDTTIDPINEGGGWDIKTMRIGEIISWHPQHVRLSVYNDKTGRREEITVPKTVAAIVVNPFYSMMNEPNSTLQRLIRKLNILDSVDEAAGSGKLDLIIQLPFVVRSEAKKQQADQRRQAIEDQLRGSKYGIAYTDGTERITQLNRPTENNMLKQIEYLTNLLYAQLGVTEEVIKGTADEKTMLNYYNSTIDPILNAIQEAMKKTFLTKTARSQKQSIEYFRDPFKLVPISQIAEIADKFTRNAILSSNEFRGIIGFKPADDPEADKLTNKNIPAKEEAPPALEPVPTEPFKQVTQ